MSPETPRGRAGRIVGLSPSPRGAGLAPAPSEAPTETMPAVGPRPPGPPAAPPPAPPPAPGADRAGAAAPANDEAPEKPARRTGMGMPALVMGVLAVGTCYATEWAGVVLGLFAVVVGYLGARRAFNGLATDGGFSLGGLALGAIGLVWGAVVVSQTLFGSAAFGDGLTLDQCLQQSTSAKEMHMCKSQHITEFNQRYPNAAT